MLERRRGLKMESLYFKRSTAHSIRIHVLPTKRFKTFSISMYAGIPLQENTVTKTALIPFVLRRGTQSYPETTQFRQRLEQLYGAGFGFDVYKRGDYQIVQFRMDTIHDCFVPGNEPLLEQTFAFLGEVLTRPVLEKGEFRQSYVHSEKETVKQKLQSIINDKVRYAAERCIQEMCDNEPYHLNPLGNIHSLDHMEANTLYDAYQNWLKTAQLDLYVVGDTTQAEVEQLVNTYFHLEKRPASTYSPCVTSGFKDRSVKTIVEHLDVNQGKLNMGLRTPVTYHDEQYVAALLYNGVLGGYPHSKLFLNVREKESLAYYVSSRYDGHKGILTIQSGIELDLYEKATKIIQQQLEQMCLGKISELELSQTKAMLSNAFKDIQDDAFDMISHDFNYQMWGKQVSYEQLLQQLEYVQIADIQQVAQTVRLDTIYFLRDKEED